MSRFSQKKQPDVPRRGTHNNAVRGNNNTVAPLRLGSAMGLAYLYEAGFFFDLGVSYAPGSYFAPGVNIASGFNFAPGFNNGATWRCAFNFLCG